MGTIAWVIANQNAAITGTIALIFMIMKIANQKFDQLVKLSYHEFHKHGPTYGPDSSMVYLAQCACALICILMMRSENRVRARKYVKLLCKQPFENLVELGEKIAKHMPVFGKDVQAPNIEEVLGTVTKKLESIKLSS